MKKEITVCDVTEVEHPHMQVLAFTLEDGRTIELDLVPEKVTELCQALLNQVIPGRQALILKELGIIK